MSSIVPLHIRLFGAFHVVRGETPAPFKSLRLQAVLAYLLLHRDAPVSRQQLAFALYPDSSDAQARGNLRRLLFDLRNTLPDADAHLDLQNATVQWRNDASFSLDVQEFEIALATTKRDVVAQRAALERARALYRGDLLPDCYDEWIVPLRETFRHMFFTTCEQSIALAEQQREYARALEHAQLLLRHDPAHEGAYRSRMRLHALTGDRAAALRAYHTCATILQRELGVEPDAETQQEYARLLNVQTAPPAPRTEANFIGRHTHWTQLQNVWRNASSGKPQLVVLEGEAGVGKTRLAQEFVTWAQHQGFSAATARCYAAEGALAFAPVTAWLRAAPVADLPDVWLTEIARLVPEVLTTHPKLSPQPLTEEWQRQRFFEALARALLAQSQPRVLLLDDVQWCDRDTLTWLRFLLRYDMNARVLVIATLRPEEVDTDETRSAFFNALASAGQFTRFQVTSFDAHETTQLAEQLAGHALEPRIATRLFAETEGNALFIVETIRAGLAELPEQANALPSQVQATIMARLAQLAPRTRELVNVAAVIGREFNFDVLAHASGSSQDALVRELDELWRRRIVRELGADAYDFTHDKLRQVTYDVLSATARRMWHMRVANALETVYANAREHVLAQIAYHYERAQQPAQAAAYYEQAADAAGAVYAHQEAQTLLERALALSPSAPLYEKLGNTLWMSGMADAAQRAFEQALAYAPRSDCVVRARLQRRSSRLRHTDSEALEWLDRAENALQETHVRDTAWHQELLELAIERLWIYYSMGDLAGMDALIARAHPLNQQYGTHAQRGRFYIRLAVLNYLRDRYRASDETLAYARAALEACRASGSVSDIAFAWFGIGFAHLWREELDDAERYLSESLAYAEQIGDVIVQTRCLTYLSMLYRKRGDAARALELAERELPLATQANLTEYIGIAHGHRAWVALRHNNLPLAEKHALTALEQFDLHVEPFLWTAIFPLLAVHLRRQATGQAVEYARLLCTPPHQFLGDDIEDALQHASAAWERADAGATARWLEQAVTLARARGFC